MGRLCRINEILRERRSIALFHQHWDMLGRLLSTLRPSAAKD
jgi:hypothetical protein